MEGFRTALKVLLAAGAMAAAFLLIWFATEVLLVVFAGILFGIFLRALADLLSGHTPLARRWSLVVVIAGLAGLAAAWVYFAWPGVAAEVDKLGAEAPGMWLAFTNYLSQYGWGKWLIQREPYLEESIFNRISITGLVTSVTDAILALFIAIFIGIYVSAQSGLYIGGAVELAPDERRLPVSRTLMEMGVMLRRWMVGRGVAMLSVGVLDWIGLAIIGVPLAGTLGIISGLLTFIPYLGSLIALVPSVLVAATVSSKLAFGAAVVHFIGQGVEAHLVTPLVQRRAVELAPAVTISAQFLMGAWAGILGVLFATPIAAIIQFLVRKFYLRDPRGGTAEN